MLRGLKRSIGNRLKAQGYIIKRPSSIELKHFRSAWAEWFSTDVERFAEIYKANRKSLACVTTWASDELFAKSFWRYGVPEMWGGSTTALGGNGIADNGVEINSSDLLVLLGKQLPHLSYLEIGVSLGKNLLQIADAFPASALTGLDVEEINPFLRKYFKKAEHLWQSSEEYEIDTLSGTKATKRASLIRMTRGKQTFDYLSADQFRIDTWQQLKGRKFNFIFSDGVHSGAALRSEFSYLNEFHLIDVSGRFVMFWDDLWDIDMQSAFLDNSKSLCQMFGVDESYISMFELHGSYGVKRPMGLFTSFKLQHHPPHYPRLAPLN